MLLLLLPALFALACTSSATGNRDGIRGVWAVDETEKIRREDVEHPLMHDRRNRVWNGREISLFGARNEVVGFQIILVGGDRNVDSIHVRLDSLSGGQDVLRAHGPSGDPFDHRGRDVELFLERYLRVDRRSEWWLAGARPLPDGDHVGWIPDALVPYDIELRHLRKPGGFAIEAGTTQAVWVDVSLPRTLAATHLRGTVVITVGKNVAFEIPVQMRVLGFTLSDTTHLSNHFFWGATTAEARHGVKAGTREYREIFRNYATTFHRHRLDLVDGRRTFEGFVNDLAPYYTGAAYSEESGYAGPGLNVGNQTYSIGTYDQPGQGWISGFWPDTPEAWQKAADRWEGWFASHAPSVLRFKYLEDEAPYSHWAAVRQKAGWIKASPGPGQHLRRAFTTRISAEMVGAVDLWLVEGHAGWKDSGGTAGFDLPRVRERQAAGEMVGLYNGMRPSYGEPNAIDNFAADARVNPWICWKYKADHYYYWETAFHADKQINIWERPVAGSLLYTGEDIIAPAEDRRMRGPIMSIRLKNLRRGFQDYEYLVCARRAGIATDEQVSKVVRAAFNDYNGSTFTNQADQPQWAERGYVFEAARLAVGEQIEQYWRAAAGPKNDR